MSDRGTPADPAMAMTVEVLTDESGTILALSAAQAGRPAEPRGAELAEPRPPRVEIRPRAGQRRHVVALPAELAGVTLREVHRSFRIVHDGGTPRLERVTR